MDAPTVSLGFTGGRFARGLHVCQVFASDVERDRTRAQFIAAGLSAGEWCRCFVAEGAVARIASLLRAEGVDTTGAEQSGALAVSSTREAYFSEGRFEPETLLQKLASFHRSVDQAGHPGARVIGEMSREIEEVPGGSRLLEYEARVTLLVRDHPITTMCQYDARIFDGASIMDILRVHPYVVVNGAVMHNPFFSDPMEFLPQPAGAR